MIAKSNVSIHLFVQVLRGPSRLIHILSRYRYLARCSGSNGYSCGQVRVRDETREAKVDLGGEKKVGDTSYCVLVIFYISLPNMYGEDTIHYLPSCELVTKWNTSA